MRKFLKSTTVATALALGTLGGLSVAPAFAIDEVLVTADASTSNLAVQGYDVIAYRTGTPTEGSSQFTATHEGATYRFANQANLDTFLTDPARYVPAYGGFCAFGVSKGQKFDIDPTAFSVVDDRLYLNYNRRIQRRWTRNQDEFISQADGNWPEIESVAVGDL